MAGDTFRSRHAAMCGVLHSPGLPGGRLDIPMTVEHTGSLALHKRAGDHENANTPALAVFNW
ncbi:hypothetical protein [Acetobacter persici]|nr:hypothetical protein [Acetobacter persici]